MRMAEISFWGGVGVIGSSKILVEQDGWRVLLDCGLDFHPGRGLFRDGVAPRAEHALADRLRTGGAPWLPRLYDPAYVAGTDLVGGGDGQTAVCITHAHLDHIGLTGFVDPSIPLFASPETASLMTALHAAHEDVEGHVPRFTAIEDQKPFNFGPFEITRYPVDHDIVGASGYSVATEDGVVAFTGDIRLHGRHPELSLAYAEHVAGARVFVCEGTMLSADFNRPVRSEEEVDSAFQQIVGRTPGLVLMSLYPRNIERVEFFLRIAESAGRRILWPASAANLFQTMGLSGIHEWTAEMMPDINAHPGQFVLQMDPENFPSLLDLPAAGAAFVHANGEPLGPFDPRWDLLKDWLDFVHVPLWSIGTSGHATADALAHLVDLVRPDILVPLHSQAPDRLLAPPGARRWLPQGTGKRYPLSPAASL